LQSADPESDAYKQNEWSANKLNMMCIEQPSVAFDVAMKIFEASKDPWVHENLGAGPLETLLTYESETTMPMIKRYIEKNPQFLLALQHIWRHSLPESVAAQLDAAVL
jgi:hypothetical protein